MRAATTILVLEDDRATRTFLSDNLAADGFEIIEADSIKEARRLLERRFADLAIIDLGLPDGDGLALISQIRESDRVASRIDPELPVVILSGHTGTNDVLRGFRRGCDDFVKKPFSYNELLARIAAVLGRRKVPSVAGRVRVGPLELDVASRQVWIDGRPVTLSNKEFGLLRALAVEPTRVYTRTELLETVWGFTSVAKTRTLDSHAARLRKKLNTSPGANFVVNVWGIGYRLVDGGGPA